MRKRTAQPTRAGQLTGTQLRIVTIHNDGLRESITLANQGTLAQPMCGWALATLRGERFYFFPDDVVMLPEMTVTIHSGQDALDAPPSDLLWTHEQMWNNRGDVAVLFDCDGLEVDRYAYPHKRITGSAASRLKRLARDGEVWRVVTLHRPSR